MKYCRKCDICNSGMNEGYIVEDSLEYFCSKSCLHICYSENEYEEMYNKNEAYYTEWDNETDVEYELINGKLKEIEDEKTF